MAAANCLDGRDAAIGDVGRASHFILAAGRQNGISSSRTERRFSPDGVTGGSPLEVSIGLRTSMRALKSLKAG